jgi:dipeptidyl aminopeptidase/acylaminoacyl peptidase
MYVGKVKTPTLLMTGVLDLRTPMPQSEEFYRALKMRGVPTALSA